jgi:hypothetical protein
MEPEVICLDIRWGEYEPLDVLTVFNMISNSIKLSDLYELEGQDDCEYILKGMIIYWGAHYYAFFRVFIDGEEEWLRVDDKTITKKGAWKDIVEESVSTMTTPTIVLYEKYKESVLVPPMKDMHRNFELDRRFMRKLITETAKSKRKATYGDSKITFVQQDSLVSEERQPKGDDDDRHGDKREENKSDSDGFKSDGERERDTGMNDELEPMRSQIAEDEWPCEDCGTINKNDDPRCKK